MSVVYFDNSDLKKIQMRKWSSWKAVVQAGTLQPRPGICPYSCQEIQEKLQKQQLPLLLVSLRTGRTIGPEYSWSQEEKFWERT